MDTLPRPTPVRTVLTIHVNGKACTTLATADTALLYVLRNDLALNGPKYGCGIGECGACTVLIDGVAARSCVIPVKACTDNRITTLEGLGNLECPGTTQQAFIACQAAQCGYCLNGMIMTVEALLRRTPQPSKAQICNELQYNLCRCGTHVEIIEAALFSAQLRTPKARDESSHGGAQ